MSTTILRDTTQVLGDASIFMVDGKFTSPGDGQVFRVGSRDWIAWGRLSQGAYDLSATSRTETLNTWVWGLGRSTDDYVALRTYYSSGNLTTLDAFWTQGASTVARATLAASSLPSGAVSTCNRSGWYWFMKKTGDTIEVGLVSGDPDSESYGLYTASDTSGTTLNLDTVMSTTGGLSIGSQIPSAASTLIGGHHDMAWAAIDTGQTWADVELDTDAQILAHLLDPHRIASTYADDFYLVRTFDLHESAAKANLPQRTAFSTPTLKDVGSSLTLSYTAGTVGYGLPPFEPQAFRSGTRNSPNTEPEAVKVGDAIFRVTTALTSTICQAASLEVRSATTGHRIKPTIPIVPAWWYTDSSDSNAFKPYYQWPSGETGVGDNHTQYSVVHDAVTGRVVVMGSWHDVNISNKPDTGDTLFASGFWADIRDGDPPDIQPVPHLGETGSYGTQSYGVLLAAGGTVYAQSRASNTGIGRWAFHKLTSGGTASKFFLSAAADSGDPNIAAAIPNACIDLGGGYALFTASTRIEAFMDYWGVCGVVVRLSDWDSATDGWWMAGTGEACATLKGTLKYQEPGLYLTPGSGLDQLQALHDSATALDPSSVDYGESLVRNGVVASSGYVGIVTRRMADAERDDEDPWTIADYKLTGAALHVWRFTGAGGLTYVRTVDLWPAMQLAAPGDDAETDYSGKDYQHTGLIAQLVSPSQIVVMLNRSDGDSYAADVNLAALNYGSRVGLLEVRNWTTATPTAAGVPTAIEASDYDSAAMAAFPIHNGGNLIGLSPVPTGSPISAYHANTDEAYAAFAETVAESLDDVGGLPFISTRIVFDPISN